MECTKVNCPMQAGTPTDNCGENCLWRTTAKTSDLIPRAAAIEYLMTNMGWRDEDGYEVDDADEKRAIITNLVNGIPAVDAVPVVRCVDCKFYYGVNEECGCNGVYHSEDWYCADGERREMR